MVCHQAIREEPEPKPLSVVGYPVEIFKAIGIVTEHRPPLIPSSDHVIDGT
jgi:hypothetical protein